MAIPDLVVLKAGGQHIAVELRVGAGRGHGAHVHHHADPVLHQKLDELIQCARRVADGEKGWDMPS
ncbi:hypothetical protein V8F63_03140 [Brevundimonas sp. LF-1]|uniref:hypothetical protein n=1 Tax=Brevundimonas sp. LF-1 TaxID=3126100 RepID=UPI0030E05528